MAHVPPVGAAGVPARPSCISQKPDLRRVGLYGVAVTAFSVLYCLPMFFEYEAETDQNTGMSFIVWTDVRSNLTYSLAYTIYTDVICRFLLPLVILVTTNWQ